MSSPHNNLDHQVFLFDIIDLIVGPAGPLVFATPATTPSRRLGAVGVGNFTFAGSTGNLYKSHTNTKQIADLRPEIANLLNNSSQGINFTKLKQSSKKIKLYKVFEDGTEKQFDLKPLSIVNSSPITVNSIDRGVRGTFVKSFEWEDLGTNPADTGFMFKSRMELLCDNISEIFYPKTISGTSPAKTISISDLFVPPGNAAAPRPPLLSLHNDFKIKVEIEYNNSDKYIQDRGIGKALKTTLFLNLVQHDIKITPNTTANANAPRFTFILEHIASIESDFLSIYGDLIKFKPGNLKLQKLIEDGEKDLNDLKVKINAEKNKATKKKLIKDRGRIKEALQKLKAKNKSKEISNKMSQLQQLTLGIYNTIDVPLNDADSFVILQEIDRTPKIEPNSNIANPVAKAKKQKRINKDALDEFQNLRAKILKGWNFSSNLNLSPGRKLVASGVNEKVSFFFLGDLLNNVIQKFYDNVNSSPVMPPLMNPSNNYEFIIGNIPVFFPDTGKIKYISIADLPISANFYNQWIQKQFINSGAKTVKLITFMRELCSSLIYSVLNRMKFAAVNYPQIRVNYLVDYDQNTKKQVFFLYATSFGDSTLIGDRQKDVEKGIFHLIPLDSNIKLIENLDFSKTDLKGYREARIEESRDIASTNVLFSDAYEVKISMPGNNCFKPGQIFYLDCTKIGFPGPSAYKPPVTGPPHSGHLQLPKNMRLQGYYTIIKVSNESTFTDKDNKWDTQIEALFMGDPYGFEDI